MHKARLTSYTSDRVKAAMRLIGSSGHQKTHLSRSETGEGRLTNRFTISPSQTCGVHHLSCNENWGVEMSTAIFDVTHSCLEYFDRAVAKHDSALLTHLIQNDDVDPRKALPCDFLGIRNSFLFWIDYTGALSLVDSSLDARLQGLADISAVVMELLDMVLRSLRRRESVLY